MHGSILHYGTFLVPHGVRELNELELIELWTMVAASSRRDLGPISDVFILEILLMVWETELSPMHK